MNAPQTVSGAYLLGIREGRDLHKQFVADGIATLETFRGALDNCETLLRKGFSGDMRDLFKGERDFWRKQIGKLASNGSARP